MKKIKSVKDVVAWRLCVGCGACVSICPEKKVKLIDVIDEGLRPYQINNNCDNCQECLKVCPGYQNILPNSSSIKNFNDNLEKTWGPLLEIWEGYASDPEIRYQGSSGGVVTALSLYCLERENVAGIIHTGAKAENSWENKTYISQNRIDLLKHNGSRYAPASPCDRLSDIETMSGAYVFIGKPCDISGAFRSQEIRPLLKKKIVLMVGIFCAGTPATRGTLDLLKKYQLNPAEISEIRYRGNGWPGEMTITNKKQGIDSIVRISYRESWGNLQKYRPFRCYLCPDSTSEFADIACGDPWYREIDVNAQGYSLILVRTERGQKILHKAVKAGYLKLLPTKGDVLKKSQQNLLVKRQEIWGRLTVLRLFGIPIPYYQGFHLFYIWWKTDLKTKFRTIFGTLKRIILRKYYRPLPDTNLIDKNIMI